jgi:SAM-dependent methyltransferase
MADLLRNLFWRCYAAVYDSLWDNEMSAAVAASVAAKLPAGAEILEIGAGTGIVTGHLTDAGFRVIACEPSQAMARLFRRRLPDIPLYRRPFDQVAFRGHQVAVNVVHLLPDPTDAVRQLQARGPVVIVTPDPNATLYTVARAQRRLGVGHGLVVRFVLAHLALGPLAVLCGVSPTANLRWAGAQGEPLLGIYRLIVHPGEAEPIPR